jgi:hypothetical protein
LVPEKELESDKLVQERHSELVPGASALMNFEVWCVAVAPDTGIVTEYYTRQINPVTNPNPTALLVM